MDHSDINIFQWVKPALVQLDLQRTEEDKEGIDYDAECPTDTVGPLKCS
ncbi:MAG: hypothetical protein ACK5AO_02535 [bacterium]